MFPYVEIFGITIGTYSIWGVIGLIIAGTLACYLGKDIGLFCEDISLAVIVLAVGIMLGGHTLYALTNIRDILNMLFETPYITFAQMVKKITSCFDGMVYYGGFIGAFIFLSVFCRIFYPNKKEKMSDIFSVCVPLFHCFARIGCFFAGCCFGIESKIGFITNTNNLIPEINGVIRIPIQLIEACINLFVFVVLYSLTFKKHKDGTLIYVYILLYAPMRFVLEFFRGDLHRGIWWHWSTSQWISVLLISVAIIKYIKNKKW